MSDRLTELGELTARIREAVVDWSPTNPRLDTVDILSQAADAITAFAPQPCAGCAALRELAYINPAHETRTWKDAFAVAQHDLNETRACCAALREALADAVETARQYVMLFHDDAWKARLSKWEAGLAQSQPDACRGETCRADRPQDPASWCANCVDSGWGAPSQPDWTPEGTP